MSRRGTLMFVAVICLASVARGDLVTINFDDGPLAGISINDFYASQGISFVDAEWSNRFNGLPGTTPSFQIESTTAGGLPKFESSITGIFNVMVDAVSISAIDVGFNDARLDVYDAAGNLLGFDVYEGQSELGNSGTSVDTHVLTVSAPGIQRIELYQPLAGVTNDSVAWDNLEYNVVPEPSTFFLFATMGIGALTAWRRRRDA